MHPEPTSSSQPLPLPPGAKRPSDLFPFLEKPGRYLGTELNSVHKDPGSVDIRLVLAFPDLYDLGLGNLGVHVLYRILNDEEGVWAERVYMPPPDLEAALRQADLPLFALESQDPLGIFDGIGFSLQTELGYTNVLAMLDLARIPLRAEERTGTHPLVFAGGPCAFNPEPMAPFLDFVVVGDGEEVIRELVPVLRSTRGQARADRLRALAAVEGVYVPSRMPTTLAPSGTVVPAPGAPRTRRRRVRDLDATCAPQAPVVPYTPQVHDRFGLEVLRGCTRGCRFCHAGFTSRPVRERSPQTIEAILDRGLSSTGYEEAGLLSLSTCDHSRIGEVIHLATARARAHRGSLSLPSLRADRFSVDLAEWLSDIRRTGLTFAPEAATERLKALINKPISNDDLVAITTDAYRRGWDRLKLYFMVGLPTETDEDVQAIADLALRVWREGKAVNRRAQLNLGVATFVPKAMTPFQWAPQISPQEADRRQRLVRGRLDRIPAIKVGWHDPEESLLEGILARGDRRCATLLEAAFRLGCRLDGWHEHRRMDLWEQAMKSLDWDLTASLAARAPGAPLPWDHVDCGVSPRWLEDQWEEAQKGQLTSDCRQGPCHACGLACRAEERIHWSQVQAHPLPPHQKVQEGPPVQRLFFRITRTGRTRFLSNQETMSAWNRALRRAQAPICYSQGFHAHPRVAFSTAFPVGEESVADYMDVVLHTRLDPMALAHTLKAGLPPGLGLGAVGEVPLKAPALMAQVAGIRWRIEAPVLDLESRLASWAPGEGRGDGLILESPSACVFTTLADEGGRMVRPRDLLPALGLDMRTCLVRRESTLVWSGDALEDLGRTWNLGDLP